MGAASRGTVLGTLPALWPLRCLFRVPALPICIPALTSGFTGIAAILGRYCDYGSGGWGFESLAARHQNRRSEAYSGSVHCRRHPLAPNPGTVTPERGRELFGGWSLTIIERMI